MGSMSFTFPNIIIYGYDSAHVVSAGPKSWEILYFWWYIGFCMEIP